MCKSRSTRGSSGKPEKGEPGVDASTSTVSTAAISCADAMLEPLTDVGEAVKRSSELWHIHGRHFDLNGFMRQHPGGSGVLEAVRGAEDSTPMFESYHSMANTRAIRERLEKFEWTGKLIDDVARREVAVMGGTEKQPVRYCWAAGGFYDVVKAKVKRHFLEKHGQGGIDPNKASVNRLVKAPTSWYIKEILILGTYVPLFVYMLGFDVFGLGISLSGWVRAGLAFLAGAMLQCFSFCTLHDASHYGLFFKKPNLQEALSRVCNAWTLWHHGLWVMHHVYGHHSFTGDHERDPDLVHAQPWVRKSVYEPKDEYVSWSIRWQGLHIPIFFMVLPGATLGQTFAYIQAALTKESLWRTCLSAATLDTRWYEYLTYILAIGVHFVGGKFLVTFCYFMGISTIYHLCIAPDHDTFESAIVNSIERKHEEEGRKEPKPNGKEKEKAEANLRGDAAVGSGGRAHRGAQSGPDGTGTESWSAGGGEVVSAGNAGLGQQRCAGDDARDDGDDWGEVQVRHSGNFCTRNFFVTQMMGGINFQIEHHLFPAVSHMYYEEIAPIIRETCREFSIPYNNHPSLWSAYKSYMKHMAMCSGDTMISGAAGR